MSISLNSVTSLGWNCTLHVHRCCFRPGHVLPRFDWARHNSQKANLDGTLSEGMQQLGASAMQEHAWPAQHSAHVFTCQQKQSQGNADGTTKSSTRLWRSGTACIHSCVGFWVPAGNSYCLPGIGTGKTLVRLLTYYII